MHRLKTGLNYNTKEQIFQYYATGGGSPKDGYYGSEFLSIIDNIISQYTKRWR